MALRVQTVPQLLPLECKNTKTNAYMHMISTSKRYGEESSIIFRNKLHAQQLSTKALQCKTATSHFPRNKSAIFSSGTFFFAILHFCDFT